MSSSSFSDLPDDIVLKILNKIFDLKTLCHCKLVSPRFHQILQFQIVTKISYSEIIFKPKPKPKPIDINLPSYESFRPMIKSITTFKFVKSLSFHLSSSSVNVDDRYVFKWKVNLSNKVDLFVFLSTISTRHTSRKNEYKGFTIGRHYQHYLSYSCLKDAILRFTILSDCVIALPLLEKVSITDSGNRGTVSLSGSKVAELRNSLPSHLSSDQTIDECLLRMYYLREPIYVPLLELPVSGYVMKGVLLSLYTSNHEIFDTLKNIHFDDFKDGEEGAYSEATMKLLKIDAI